MSSVIINGYLWFKALHVLAVIAWMAGMMYLPRLFIYHHQSTPGGEAETLFVMMEKRLQLGIMNPSIGAVWVFGLLMVAGNPSLLQSGWFHVKLLFVIAISGIHGFYAASRRKFAAGERPRTERFWRLMNEAPFIGLIIIVIMVVVKPF